MPLAASFEERSELPKLTAEVFVIPTEEKRFIVYAPLCRIAFIANASVVNALAKIERGDFSATTFSDKDLLRLFRDLEIVDGVAERLPLVDLSDALEPTSVTLFLTTACNLRCRYCYASAGEAPVHAMPPAVARQGIDFVLRNAVKRGHSQIEIAFHGGGEPTMNWTTLTAAMDYAKAAARRSGVQVVGGIASNGVLSQARARWIVDNLSSATISLDGPAEIHDRNRPTATGKGSSAATIRTLRRFDEHGFDYSLRVTVTADAIARLPDSVEFICQSFRPRAVQIEPAYNLGRWRDAPSAETAAFIEAYREADLRARRLGRAISFSAARLGSLTNHFCGATQNSFCLSPNGNVSSCYEVFSENGVYSDIFFYGRADDAGGYVFDPKRISRLRRQSVENRAFCAGCFAKWTCGGDCYHKALAATEGAEEFRGAERCHIIRELTKDQILRAIAASGGPIWRQPAGETQREAGHDEPVAADLASERP